MKDYIVILFGEFKNSRTVYEVMTCITPVVESENLKFNYNDLSIICHFQSENSQEEIYMFIHSAIQYDMVNMFFVSEEKKLSYYMDNSMKRHLMDLSESENSNMVIDMDKIRKGEDGLLEQDLINLPIVFDDEEEDDRSEDEKRYAGIDKAADHQGPELDRGEIRLSADGSDQRSDHVLDQGLDHFAEPGTDDHADGEVHYVSFEDECFELVDDFHSARGFTRAIAGA